MTDKLYIVRTKTDGNVNSAPKNKLNGVFATREKAEACADEIRGRNDVQRHNVKTSEIRIEITEIDADKFYEDI